MSIYFGVQFVWLDPLSVVPECEWFVDWLPVVIPVEAYCENCED